MHLKKVFLTFFFTALCFYASAVPITKFNFTGLRKTKPEYIEKVLSRFYGQEADDNTIHEIETALQAEGLFDNIKVQSADQENTENSSGEISISLQEKITFIPLPFAACSNGKWMGGAMILNMNAFGTKSMFMGGTFFTSTSFTGMAAFSKPAANTKDLGYGLFCSGNINSAERKDIYDETFVKYKQKGFSASGSIHKKITDFTIINTGLGCSWLRFDEYNGYVPQEKYVSFINPSAGISHGRQDWNDWFLSTKSLRLESDFYYNTDEKDWSQRYSGSLLFQMPVTKKLRFCSAAGFVYGKNLYFSQFSGGSSGFVSILPGEFSTDRIWGGNTGMEFALKKFKFGLFSFYGNYQACQVRDTNVTFQFCQGAAGGIRLYLSKIAFPAFAMEINKNITTSKWNYTGSIGISM